MKVKKFRLRPRVSVVARILKSIMGTRQLPSGVEESLPSETQNFLSHISPAAFYQTWSRENIPALFRDALASIERSAPVAVSGLVSTIGSEPEEYLTDLLMNGETQKSQIATAFCEESADLSFQFLLKLLANDAKSDDCEISEPVLITDSSLLQKSLELLNASQENITIDTALHLTPRFTRVGLVAWFPISKKKKSSAPLSKKKPA